MVLTINPAAMPARTELVIGIAEQSKGSRQGLAAGFGLIKDGSPLACHAPHVGMEPGGAKVGARS